uniref:Tensin 3 n=1 Tax=Oryzias latipes TaxID=8090 RepID=A0A3B3HGF9_ORYLA
MLKKISKFALSALTQLLNLSQKHEALTRMNHKVIFILLFRAGCFSHVNVGYMGVSLVRFWTHVGRTLWSPVWTRFCMCAEKWRTGYRLILSTSWCCIAGEEKAFWEFWWHLTFTSATCQPDLSLDHFAMWRFYKDKLSTEMTPSQKRYAWTLGSVLKGGLRMRFSPCFLLCVVLHGLPKIDPDGGCCLFLRVYQSLQAVCTSPVYHANAAQTNRLYFVLQPAQLLNGDITVVSYHKNSWSGSRQVVFRLQFHTGIIAGHTLSFSKADLDCACEDSSFPDDGKLELLFSESPERFAGRELWHNGPTVTVDYDTLDPLVRRDSYKDMSDLQTASSHFPELGNGSLHRRVKKKSKEEGPFQLSSPNSPCRSDRAPSASSDSGLSVASQGLGGARQRGEATQDKGTHPGKLVFGADSDPAQALMEVMAQLALSSEAEVGVTINGKSSSDRETDILDDEDEAEHAVEGPSSSSGCSLLSETLKEKSTDRWVRQHTAPGASDSLPTKDKERTTNTNKQRPSLLLTPLTPPQGLSSREVVHTVPVDGVSKRTGKDHTLNMEPSSLCQEEELAALTSDVDESIEQLNQLILDLDPTFVPVSTSLSPLSRTTSLQTNGLSLKGSSHRSGWKQQRQITDVTDYVGPQSPGWSPGAQRFKGSSAFSLPFSPSQYGRLHKTSSVDYHGQMHTSDLVPPTPAFPVTPPTPYVKHFSEVSHLRTGGQWEHGWTQESRSFLDSMNRSSGGGSTDGELFRSDVTSASCQKIFGSMCSVSSGSPLPHTDSSTPPPVWLDRTPSSLNSPYPPQPSPPHTILTPNAHSSPLDPLKSLAGTLDVCKGTDSTDLSSLLLLGNGDLERSLLEAVEDLGSLNLGGDRGPAPMLPEKRRGMEAGETGSHSPSLSGFSSPHSSSSLSISFSPSTTSDPFRGLSGAPSPGADSSSKQDTVKFVQDTSKFWYKPDISRDQAIAVLKDKEPGSFIVRDSHSFRGAYGLAMKVATPPPTVLQHSKKGGDLSNELVRHFLIECTPKGVRLKGCPNEPYFGSLTALVCQHSITPLALPCRLILPDRDPVEELSDSPAQTATNSAADLLKQGAACNVWYLGSVELESLTGHQAVQKATTVTLTMDPPPPSTVVHFKVSAQGITLTDNQRKLFFRRHYAVNTVIFCSLDPQGRKWTRDSGSTAKIFGFVARKSQSDTENMCHLFAEHDPEQPASAIVNFVSKVMIGSHKK